MIKANVECGDLRIIGIISPARVNQIQEQPILPSFQLRLVSL